MALIRDRDFLADDGSVPDALLLNCIKEHRTQVDRFGMLADYYDGKHAIVERNISRDVELPNNRIVCNHAAYITDVATGYFIGNPVDYASDVDMQAILDCFKRNQIHNLDTELVRDISKYGIGIELAYMSSDESPIPKSTNLDPRGAFLVVDDTVEYRSMFAVHYMAKLDMTGTLIGYDISVYLPERVMWYRMKDINGTGLSLYAEEPHWFGRVPVIEYWNRSNLQGDFEGVISIIDAYNLLQSDRLNDKEQLVDAILAVIGTSLGDTEAEMTNTAKLLKRQKMLELPEGADAKWLVKGLVESEVEILKDALKQDIHEFAMVPNLTDENFAAQASGVAMKYKLFGLEQLAKTKEGYYIIGLRERLQLYANALRNKAINVDVSDVEITMKRSLPANELELSQMVTTLDGTVSLETRLGLLPFIKDIEAEVKRITEEKDAAMKRQQKAFGSYDFTQTNDEDDTAGGDVNAGTE